jgi:hypothetical protein
MPDNPQDKNYCYSSVKDILNACVYCLKSDDNQCVMSPI